MKKKGNVLTEEEYLRNVPLPKKTETYTVISHGDIIDQIRTQMKENGFEIEDEIYFYSSEGEIAQGKFYIKSEKDEDMGMLFTWQNSYNKKVKFACAVGSFIYDNKASWIGTEGYSWLRKHTGTANDEAINVIKQLISSAEMYFDKIIAEKEKMKAMTLSNADYGCIMGALYFEEGFITPTQASVVIKERKKPTHEYTDKDTLWGLYKVIMFGMEGMDISKWMKSQQKVHHAIMNEYLITQNIEEKASEVNEEKVSQEIEQKPFISREEGAKIRAQEKEDVKTDTDKLIYFEDKAVFIQEACKQLGFDKGIVEYYAENKLDLSKGIKQNIQNLIVYINPKEKPQSTQITDEQIEVIEKEREQKAEATSLFEDEKEEIVSVEEQPDYDDELELALSLDDDAKEVLNDDSDVEIIPPTKKEEKEIVEEVEEEPEGLEMSDDMKELVNTAEKRMKELYGVVTEYEFIDTIAVRLITTGEVFYL